MTYLKRAFLFVISFPFFSRFWGAIARLEHPKIIAKKAVDLYAKYYKIDMKNYEGTLEDYPSLNLFFTRKIDSDIRPLINESGSFLSPCDGKLSLLEHITTDIATQVKGRFYFLSELIRKELDFSEGYLLLTIYLSPKDYHRYHVPVDSTAKSYLHTGLKLFPVNNFSITTIDRIFIRNERVVVKMEHEDFQYFYIAVGAAFVGSIKMNFCDGFIDGEWETVGKKYQQNQELGKFEMGSTILLLVPEKAIGEIRVSEGETLRAGDPLFTLK